MEKIGLTAGNDVLLLDLHQIAKGSQVVRKVIPHQQLHLIDQARWLLHFLHRYFAIVPAIDRSLQKRHVNDQL